MLKKILNWFLLLSITLGLLISIVAVVELYCGYSYFRYRDTLRNEVNTIRLREPFHNYNKQLVDSFGRSVTYRTDSNGFILPHKPITKNNTVIGFLGGSTTECQLVAEDKRVHVLVEKKIDSITCLNIGNSGNHSLHSLDIFSNKLLKYNPEVVVINHNVNDLSILLNTGSYFNNHPNRSLLITDSKHLFNYTVGMAKNWFVRNYIPYISLTLLPTTFEGAGQPQKSEFSREPLSTSYSMEFLRSEFRKSILGLVSLVKAWGVKPVILTQGSCFKYFKINSAERFKGYDLDQIHNEYNKVVREVSKELEVELVDAEALMEDQKAYFYDAVHYTDSGSVFISKHIAKAVKKVLD